MKKTLITVLALSLVLSGCLKTSEEKEVKEEVIKIGVILPLTGNAAVYGLSAKEGIDLSLEDINNTGGINGKTIQMIYEDSQCDSTKAVSAAHKLINIDKVQIIIGHICSNAAMAVVPSKPYPKI